MCSLDSDLKTRARMVKLDYSGALEFGILFKLAEIEDYGYPPNKLSEKIAKLAEKLQDALGELEKKHENLTVEAL